MKICPRCQKTYVDDNLNFCLEDGSVLSQASQAPPQTVMMAEPRPTQPQPQMASHPGSQQSWNTPQQYSMQPPKKASKTWVWVLLILGVVVLVCGGGSAVLVLFSMNAGKNTADIAPMNNRTSPPVANKGANNTSQSNSSTASNNASPSASSRTDLETVDLEPWVKEFSAYGNTEFTGGEFVMSSKKKDFYYVLVAPEEYKTEKADTRVTLRNVDNVAGNLGFGLIFHSNPMPLQQGYAFLIDTKKKRYRVARHEPQNEKSVQSWTTSPAIREGSEENTLEVRDLDDKIELYINGTMVTSIKNLYGYSGGVPGLYAGDGVKVAFKNLEIRK